VEEKKYIEVMGTRERGKKQGTGIRGDDTKHTRTIGT
jgi:hypothetical protein